MSHMEPVEGLSPLQKRFLDMGHHGAAFCRAHGLDSVPHVPTVGLHSLAWKAREQQGLEGPSGHATEEDERVSEAAVAEAVFDLERRGLVTVFFGYPETGILLTQRGIEIGAQLAKQSGNPPPDWSGAAKAYARLKAMNAQLPPLTPEQERRVKSRTQRFLRATRRGLGAHELAGLLFPRDDSEE